MSEYKAPLADIRFVLEHIAGLKSLSELPEFSHADPDVVWSVLDEGARFVSEQVAPLNRPGDLAGSVLRNGQVHTPDRFKEAYQAYVEAGWGAVDFPEKWGGHQMPKVVGLAFEEMLTAANMSFSLCPLLTAGGVAALSTHGDRRQKDQYLPRMISGEWSATMELSEPHAGSDLGTLKTRAVPHPDGSYRITGTKIFITYGEHDMTSNIIHFVLARLPDAPPGTKGISLFLIPKFLPDKEGQFQVPNDLKVVSIEHKLGIKASPTCVMSYGEDQGGAVGFLVGGEHQGMRCMFTMMNAARLGVGMEGMAIAERAYQQAAEYARVRKQGRAPGASEESYIIEHPDVRRMLMTMRANVESMRALLYRTAMHQDLAEFSSDESERIWHKNCTALLTPVVKAWCTDLGVALTSIGIQVHGGVGFVEETGAAQHYRDARITPIYEGTNGIQAIDLVTRKIPIEDGKFVRTLLDEMRGNLDCLRSQGLEQEAISLADGLETLEKATEWLLDANLADQLAGAAPFCTMFGIVAGGTLMAESICAAPDNLTKQATARFYLNQILPTAQGYLPAVTAGVGPLSELSEQQF